jgi:hypothetical protein
MAGNPHTRSASLTGIPETLLLEVQARPSERGGFFLAQLTNHAMQPAKVGSTMWGAGVQGAPLSETPEQALAGLLSVHLPAGAELEAARTMLKLEEMYAQLRGASHGPGVP